MPLRSVMHVKGCHTCRVTHTCKSPKPLQALTAYLSCRTVKAALRGSFSLVLHAAFTPRDRLLINEDAIKQLDATFSTNALAPPGGAIKQPHDALMPEAATNLNKAEQQHAVNQLGNQVPGRPHNALGQEADAFLSAELCNQRGVEIPGRQPGIEPGRPHNAVVPASAEATPVWNRQGIAEPNRLEWEDFSMDKISFRLPREVVRRPCAFHDEYKHGFTVP